MEMNYREHPGKRQYTRISGENQRDAASLYQNFPPMNRDCNYSGG